MTSTLVTAAPGAIAGSAQQHTLTQSIALHLIPGVLGTVFYVLTAPVVTGLGFPPLLAIYLAIIVIVAIELGVMLLRGKRQNGRLSLQGNTPYREPLSARQYLVLVPAVFVWGIAVTGLIAALESSMQQSLFGWLPDSFLFRDVPHYGAMYSRSALLITLAVGIVLNGLVGPIVEEMYFRGYLLSRLERFGVRAIVLNAILFSLYHFWTPWQFFSRVLVVLPWGYIAQRKRNIIVGTIVHCLNNLLGTIVLFAAIFNSP